MAKFFRATYCRAITRDICILSTGVALYRSSGLSIKGLMRDLYQLKTPYILCTNQAIIGVMYYPWQLDNPEADLVADGVEFTNGSLTLKGMIHWRGRYWTPLAPSDMTCGAWLVDPFSETRYLIPTTVYLQLIADNRFI